MTKESLQVKLDDLKQQSENTLKKLDDYEKVSQSLREEALMIKGKYQAVEELLLSGFPETDAVSPKSKKG